MDKNNSSEVLATTLINFIAENPHLEFGSPGPVIHFLERKGHYESELIHATYKKPNWYLLWMLNRCINDSSEYRDEMLKALKFTAERTDIDDSIAEDARDFYEFQLD